MNFWRAMALGGYLLGWFERAARDGRITVPEVLELVQHLILETGLNIEIDVPPPPFGDQTPGAHGPPMGPPRP